MDNMKVTSRPIRIRKISRKSWTQNGDSDRPLKRLFTPEIKKLLKDWLVRRRENPYPSREEKKTLAIDTGLTYTQICNWFANWRRKLKNTSEQKKSWGNLIKNYNFSARGNVEQFSICSSDSIWAHQEAELSLDSLSINQNSDGEVQDLTSKPNSEMHFEALASSMAHGQKFAASFFHHPQNSQLAMNFFTQAQCLQQQINPNDLQSHESQKQYFSNSNKFKNHIMEKYLRGLDDETNNNNNNNNNINNNNDDDEDDDNESLSNQHDNEKKPELSKWLESTANFQPSKNNYNIDFVKAESKKKSSKITVNGSGLYEKELIAAETLVLLKNFHTTKFYNS